MYQHTCEAGRGRRGVYARTTAGTASPAVQSLEQSGDQAYVMVGELAGAVLGAGLGEPGADPDGIAVDTDRLTGGRDAALAVQEELQQLDGLLERAAGPAGGSQRIRLGGEPEGGQQLLLTVGESRPGGDAPARSRSSRRRAGSRG
ncbi:hypothetical protein AMK32_25750 [Streptomyces sp. CB01883]|nr:hypothetical protein AMK32_25750 [Streptomyces sp. CB01883]